MRYIILFIGFFLCVLCNKVIAQTIPVGTLDDLEDVYRRAQLLGTDSVGRSFMLRPISIKSETEQVNRKFLFKSDELKAKLYLLPVVLQQQYNHLPYGTNDGAMIPNKGYGGIFSAGVFASIGPFSVQLRPEIVYAENQKFVSITNSPNSIDFFSSYRDLMRSMDLPERFGTKPYNKINLGQSSIRANIEQFSVGLSNESLWWGPGVRNSLLMSNNAPGFLHFTLNTLEPVPTDIGNFEGQFIVGTLKSSGVALPARLKIGKNPGGDRSIVGITLNYNPKWIKGFYIGFDHTSVKNEDDIDIDWPTAEFYVSNINKGQKSDSYTSLFGRWVLPESKAEFYVQYGFKTFTFETPGRGEKGPITQKSDRLRAYVAGFNKLISLNRASDEFIKVGVEVTEMQNKNTRVLYPWPSWYNNYSVPGGYTNEGQVLGAGIGPGGSMQGIDVSWVKGLKRIGFQIERMVQNNDMYYSMNPYTADMRKHWIELAFGGKIDWDFGPLILNSQLTYISSLNYQWRFDRPPTLYKSYWDWQKHDAKNLQLKLGMMYQF